MRRIVTLLATSMLLFSSSALAACWSGQVQCLTITPGKEHSIIQQCQAFSCANVHSVSSGWTYAGGTEVFSGINVKTHDNTIAINKTPAKVVTATTLKKGYECFTVSGKRYYCSINLPH